MKLKFETIADRGVPNMERVHLSVVEATNLGFHVVLASTYVTENSVGTGRRASFWFPPIDVLPGDQIILYSRTGIYADPVPTLIPSKRTFFFYWGEPQTIWHAEGSCAVVIDIASWQTSPNNAPPVNALVAALRSGNIG